MKKIMAENNTQISNKLFELLQQISNSKSDFRLDLDRINNLEGRLNGKKTVSVRIAIKQFTLYTNSGYLYIRGEATSRQEKYSNASFKLSAKTPGLSFEKLKQAKFVILSIEESELEHNNRKSINVESVDHYEDTHGKIIH